MTDEADESTWRKRLALIGGVSLVLHLVFAFVFARRFPELGGTQIYDQGYGIALNLNAGRGYLHTWFGLDYLAWRPPVFPLLLAGSVSLFGDTLGPVKVMLAVFGATTSMVTGSLARRLFDARVGLVAAVMTALDPSLIFSSGWPEPSNLIALELALGCLLLIRCRDGGLRDAFLAGLMMGITVLSKTFYLTWPIIATVWLVLQQGEQLKLKLKKAAVIWAVTLTVASPWVVRNYLLFRTPRIATTDTSLVFWAANSESWLNSNVMDVQLPPREFYERFDQFKDLSEIERDRWFLADAKKTVAANRGAYVRRVFERIWLIWKPFPYVRTWTPLATAKFVGMTLTFAPILAAFLASVWTLRRQWRTFSLFYLLIAGVTGSLALVHGVSRYRVPLEPLLIAQGSYAAWLVLARWRKMGAK